MAQSLCSINWGIEGPDDSQMVPSPNRANSNASIFISIAFGIIIFLNVKRTILLQCLLSINWWNLVKMYPPYIITSLVMSHIAHTPLSRSWNHMILLPNHKSSSHLFHSSLFVNVCIQSKTTMETTWRAAQTRKNTAPAIVDYGA